MGKRDFFFALIPSTVYQPGFAQNDMLEKLGQRRNLAWSFAGDFL